MLGGGGLIVIALSFVAYHFLSPVRPNYVLAEASERDLAQTVHAHGIVSSAQNVDLSFDRSGRVADVFVDVGSQVAAGDRLVALENSIEAAQLAGAQAALDQKAAGVTSEQLEIYSAAVDAAKAALQQTDDGGSLITKEAKENEVTALSQTLPVLEGALSGADNIVAVDNIFANESFRDFLSTGDKTRLYAADNQYAVAKKSIADFRAGFSILTNQSAEAEVSKNAAAALVALNDTATLLTDVSDALSASSAEGTLAEPNLGAKKSAIQTLRTAVTAQYAVVQGKVQATEMASATLVQREAAYDQARATLHSASNPVRSVDLEPLRAAVALALANYNKTILRSPVSGTVSRNDAKIGSVISVNAPMVSVINADKYQIETYISENNVGKIKAGDTADVTVDAFGGGTVFPATVSSVDQSAVSNGGGLSYKVVLSFTKPDARLKAGMNANIVLKSGDVRNVLSVPERSVIQRDDKYYVLVQNGGSASEQREVTIGTRGDDSWEILSGLKSGDKVINFGL